jgi:hypothetical protein
MTAHVFHVESQADLARAIVLAEAQGALGFAHLGRALSAGRIAFQPLPTDISASRFKAFARLTRNRPSVVLIGDDAGFEEGPDGWRLAGRAIAWAKAVMIHAAGAEVVHYESAIVAAQITGRCLVIECGTATLPAWVALVRAAPHKPPSLIVRPRGGVHPLPVRREGLH